MKEKVVLKIGKLGIKSVNSKTLGIKIDKNQTNFNIIIENALLSQQHDITTENGAYA